MKKYTEEELAGKFVVAFDTLFQGHQCVIINDEISGEDAPLLFDSADEAIKEIFDDNHSMLESHLESDQLEELNEGVTPEMIAEMKRILDSDNADEMCKFMEQYPQCNDSGSWVEPANEFVMNRKVLFGENGGYVTGKKLSEL
jgi:hypothetical protein